MKLTKLNSLKTGRQTLLISSLVITLFACGGEQETVSIESSVLPERSGFEIQAAEGAELFAANCAVCHGPNLEGTTLGPIISGNNFLRRWGTQSPVNLLNNIQTNMPPGGSGALGGEEYLSITAHILATNGMDGISEALSADSNIVIAENFWKQRATTAYRTSITTRSNSRR